MNMNAYEDLVYQAGIMLGDYEKVERPTEYTIDPELMDEDDRLRADYPDEKIVDQEFLLGQLELHEDENDHPCQVLHLAAEPFYDTLKGIVRDPQLFLTEDHLDFLINFTGVIEYRDDLPVLIISGHDAPSAEEIRENNVT